VSDGADRPSRGSVEARALRTALTGAALFDLGHSAEGVDRLHEAHLLAAGAGGPAEVTASVAVLEHAAATALGRGDLARSAASWAEEELGAAGELVLLHARQRAAHGRYRPASDALVPLWDGSAPPVLPWTLADARVLECGLALRLDQRARARRELDHALELCAAMDVVRPLASGPAEVIDLLVRHVGSFGNQEDLAARVLATQRRRAAPPVALTDRERAVLSLLPTQRSFEEIADDLTVSHSTVKTHVRAIYSKFGVSSRREAVARARRHGILSADLR
jgi:LuxR family maltose regulon positive regulatory protein